MAYVMLLGFVVLFVPCNTFFGGTLNELSCQAVGHFLSLNVRTHVLWVARVL